MKSCTNKNCKQENPQPVESFRLDSKTKTLKSWCNTCSHSAVAAWRIANPTKFKASTLKKYWPELSGSESLDEYNKLLEAQNHGCGICQIPAKDLKFGLCVDHCHSTGKVRGLLCDNCNQALGLLKDNSESLQRAIKYLE